MRGSSKLTIIFQVPGVIPFLFLFVVIILAVRIPQHVLRRRVCSVDFDFGCLKA
jgi:hypothetical protein